MTWDGIVTSARKVDLKEFQAWPVAISSRRGTSLGFKSLSDNRSRSSSPYCTPSGVPVQYFPALMNRLGVI